MIVWMVWGGCVMVVCDDCVKGVVWMVCEVWIKVV